MSLFSDKSISVMEGGKPGIYPVREFCVTSRFVKEDRRETDGIVPYSLFKLRTMLTKDGVRDKKTGSVPVRFVLRISIFLNMVNIPKVEGIVPHKLLKDMITF